MTRITKTSISSVEIQDIHIAIVNALAAHEVEPVKALCGLYTTIFLFEREGIQLDPITITQIKQLCQMAEKQQSPEHYN